MLGSSPNVSFSAIMNYYFGCCMIDFTSQLRHKSIQFEPIHAGRVINSVNISLTTDSPDRRTTCNQINNTAAADTTCAAFTMYVQYCIYEQTSTGGCLGASSRVIPLRQILQHYFEIPARRIIRSG